MPIIIDHVATFYRSNKEITRFAINTRTSKRIVIYRDISWESQRDRRDVDIKFVCKHWQSGIARGEFTARSSLGCVRGRPTTMAAKRERELYAGTRSQFNLPTTRLCLAVIISGVSINVFRAYFPSPLSLSLTPPSPAERTANTRSFAIDRDTHTHRNSYTHTLTHTHDDDVRDRPFEDEIDRWLVPCQK